MFNSDYTDAVLSQLGKVLDEEGSVMLEEVLVNPEDVLLSLKEGKQIYNPLKEVNVELSCNLDLEELFTQLFQKPISLTYTAKRFTWRDYLLLEEKELIAFLDLTPNFPEMAGGKLLISDGEGNVTIVPPTFNSLTIAKNRFHAIEYCNHYAKDNFRLIVLIKFKKK